jgi:hypothetical protein
MIEGRMHDVCGVHFPGLVRVMPGGIAHSPGA